MDESSLNMTGIDRIFSNVLGQMAIRISCDGYVILEAEKVSPETCTGIVRQLMELAAYDKTQRLLHVEATGGTLPPVTEAGQVRKATTGEGRKKPVK